MFRQKTDFLIFPRCFSFQKKSCDNIFLPISNRNLLRNPKIILRIPCGQPKDAKKQKIIIYCTNLHISTSRELSFRHPLYRGVWVYNYNIILYPKLSKSLANSIKNVIIPIVIYNPCMDIACGFSEPAYLHVV